MNIIKYSPVKKKRFFEERERHTAKEQRERHTERENTVHRERATPGETHRETATPGETLEKRTGRDNGEEMLIGLRKITVFRNVS